MRYSFVQTKYEWKIQTIKANLDFLLWICTYFSLHTNLFIFLETKQADPKKCPKLAKVLQDANKEAVGKTVANFIAKLVSTLFEYIFNH